MQALTKTFSCLNNETAMCLLEESQEFVTGFISIHTILKKKKSGINSRTDDGRI